MRPAEPTLTPVILFDLDGTLADTLPDITASVNFVRELAGLPGIDAEAVRPMVGDGARVLLERALADDPRRRGVDAVFERFRDHHAEQCTKLVALYPDVRERLGCWHREGRRLGIVTNKPEAFARRIVAHLGLEELLDVVIGGDSTPWRKPEPGPLQAALERLAAETADAMIVGDGVQDIRAGKAAGLRTVGALWGYRGEAELRREAADEYWRRLGVVA